MKARAIKKREIENFYFVHKNFSLDRESFVWKLSRKQGVFYINKEFSEEFSVWRKYFDASVVESNLKEFRAHSSWQEIKEEEIKKYYPNYK